MGDPPGRLHNPLAERPATRPLVGCSAAPSASRAGREFPPPSSDALSATLLSRGPSAWRPRWFPARPAQRLGADCASGETPPRAGSAAAGRHAAAPRGRGGSGRVGAVVGDVGRGTCGCRGSQRGSSSKDGTLPRDPAARCCVYTRERRRRGLEEAVTHPRSRQVRREGRSPQVSLRRQRDEPNVVRLQP